MKKKGRGLSFDEKKDKMLKIFNNSVSFYHILEKCLQLLGNIKAFYKSRHTISKCEINIKPLEG
jgi:hypothetical protein